MTTLKTLLLAIDSSRNADAALIYGVYFHKQLAMPLEALHVIDERAAAVPLTEGNSGDASMLLPAESGLAPSLFQDALEEQAKDMKCHADDLFQAEGVDTRLEVTEGIPVEVIKSHTGRETLVILGRAGESTELDSHPHVGALVERILQRTQGSVLLVPDVFEAPQRFVVGYDGSAAATAALEAAYDVAKRLRLPVLVISAGSNGVGSLKDAEARAQAAGVQFFSQRVGDKVDEAILGALQSGDILAIGVSSSNWFSKLFRTPTSISILRRAQVPVLLHP